jgi:vacuolar-type H+-ATPase subunit E/Vma4
MTGLPKRSAAALAPVRGSLLTAARQQAADIRRSAGEQALALMEAARHEADRICSAAAEEGAATARSQAALRSARVRREAHEMVLTRRNALRLALRRQIRESTMELRSDLRYPRLLARMIEQSHALLGPDATVAESPEGGVVAEAGSRRLDLSLPVLATRTLESMTPEVCALWTG